jgi:FkbM family methyltransferase
MQATPTPEKRSSGFEHQVRAITKHVPFRVGATLFNAVMSTIGKDGRAPNWQVSEGVGSYPAMELNVSSPFQRRMFYFPRAYWERLMSLPFGRFLASTLKEGQVFLDIGANVGFYSLFAARRVGPSGRVIAFEPDPMTFESLTRSLRYNGLGWASSVNVALSDREGEMPFFTVSDGSAHSLVPEIASRAGRYSGKALVRVTRLDDLVREKVVDAARIDLIKIDVEGEEPRTVAGMLATLERFAYPPVWAEVRGPRGSTRAPNTYPAVARALQSLGYGPLKWKKGVFLPVREGEVKGREDVLFRHPAGAPSASSA